MTMLLFLVYLFFDFVKSKPAQSGDAIGTPNTSVQVIEKKEVDQIINRHLVTTSKVLEIRKMQREFDLNNPQINQKSDLSVKNQVDSQSVKPKEASPKATNPKVDLGGQILEESAKEQLMRYQDYQEQQAYIRQFKKNAWEGGVYVEVDDSGKVLKARPLTDNEKRLPFPDFDKEN